jgi:hypothetical protein
MALELAYPVGHPAHPDYQGEPWKNPAAVFDEDFPEGHPARHGANVRLIDTPDGQRAAHLARQQDLQALAMMGSLPAVTDPAICTCGKPWADSIHGYDTTQHPFQARRLELTPEQLAHVYAVRNGLQPPLAAEVTQRYGLTAQADHKIEDGTPAPTEKQIAVAHIVGLGYTPERARELFMKYGAVELAADREANANR